MSFFLIALGAAVTVGLLRSWSLAVASPPSITLVAKGVPKGTPRRVATAEARPADAGLAASPRGAA